MVKIKAFGPVGVMCALGNVDVEFMGLRVRKFRSGKIVATGMGYGETTTTRFYINGNRCNRHDFMSSMSKLVKDGEEITLEGPTQ